MTKVLLSLHVLAALVAIGPVTVAASMFPAATRRATGGTDHDLAVLRTLHRICRVYAAVGIAIPVFGFATAGSLGVTGDAWVIVSIVLTAIAAAVLVLVVLPRQQGILDGIAEQAEPEPRAPARLAMYTGIFNVLWAVVTVLMIVRPGSTTSA
ncbi:MULTISPECIES: DUF2269 family protein [Amycolatopsis]|uniref:Membrane protein n=2 Tax=Amycolatopsis TaxID=1813 RepID=A0ABP7IAX9_9PSEU|nr:MULTISPECIES: DUF2269 family protein [Amycolatopsis]MCF6427826.1 DUF2269 family protein [Amycolatopsis tucumanensis]ROS42711.1 putative integral membrane protein DUF2269 [Amycolatopsis thermoflava]